MNELNEGDCLGECTVIKLIGRGGFAEVYLAESEVLKTLAVKLYTDPSLDFDYLFKEVRAMALFNDKPYFVKFLGASDIRAHHQYILMEYMESGSLRDKLRREERIDVNEAIRVGYSIALALRDMHDINMVHRDVAPDNIFLDKYGQVKLGDLGLAAKKGDYEIPTFKKYYTAPEILQYSESEHLPASDIYSLGITLYELLGADPRMGVSSDGIAAMNAPDYFKTVIKEMCGPDPQKRCSANDVVKALGSNLTLRDVTFQPEIYTSEPVREIVLRGFIQTKREQAFIEIWEANKQAIYSGLNEDLQAILNRSLHFSLSSYEKASNLYIGIEHLIWVLLERGSELSYLFSNKGITVENLRREIFNGIKGIEYMPSLSVISPRLERILGLLKQNFPDGVGIKAFLPQLFEQGSFFKYLLSSKGLDVEKMHKELKNEV